MGMQLAAAESSNNWETESTAVAAVSPAIACGIWMSLSGKTKAK